jgi:lipoprotein-anchoring transpeptidase ErfK/SrfK
VGPAPVALTTTPLGEQQGEPPANHAASPCEPAPSDLTATLSGGAKTLDGLASLRRLAVEFSQTKEAARARTILAQERARGLAAKQGDPSTYAETKAFAVALARAYVATLDPQARRGIRARVLAASQAVLSWKGAQDTTVFAEYTVASGDSLGRIASKHRTDYRLIKALNGLRSDTIRIGQRLKVPSAGVTVLIYKRDFEVLAFYGDILMRAYDCATGKDGKTPEGNFVIGNKLVNPDWYAPDGKVYRFGTKENVLGTRWLAFKNTAEHQGFGIHGTSFPESIGTEASMGCIRLRNGDVEDLYEVLPPGSSVRVIQ